MPPEEKRGPQPELYQKPQKTRHCIWTNGNDSNTYGGKRTQAAEIYSLPTAEVGNT